MTMNSSRHIFRKAKRARAAWHHESKLWCSMLRWKKAGRWALLFRLGIQGRKIKRQNICQNLEQAGRTDLSWFALSNAM